MYRLTEQNLQEESGAEMLGATRRRLRLVHILRSNCLLFAVLAIAAVCIAQRISLGEFHLNFDESLHAMSGYFFLDVARDLPFSHPGRYAQLYYAHYPAISGLIHWPPVFYLCEALSFRVFGPSVASARFTVLCFSLFGIFFWYRMVKGFLGEWPAAFSSLAFSLVPSMFVV
jgi:4-amino-4-deoxy-L-arabinose transferase-like glycosyltransferase